jgi:tripeptidyl-peptidase-1
MSSKGAPVMRRSHVQLIAGSDLQADHEIVIAVKQHGRTALENALNEMYFDRGGSGYRGNNSRKYLTRQEVAELSGHEQSSIVVQEYLLRQGFRVVEVSRYGEYITATTSIQQLNTIFDTSFRQYRVRQRGQRETYVTVNRVDKYSLPHELEDHVEDIFNMDQFPPSHLVAGPKTKVESSSDKTTSSSVRSNQVNIDSSDNYATPALLTSTYHIRNNESWTLGSQCVYSTSQQNYSPSDLVAFQSYYDLPSTSIKTSIGGHNSSSKCLSDSSLCAEANLDVQYMLGISPYVVDTYYWYDNSTRYFMLDWIKTVSAMSSPPLVLSISYGVSEADVSRGYARAFDTEAIKLALQGVTVLVSAGDDGAPGYLARGDSAYCGYYPLWPATSAYVTAVGGTQLSSSGSSESACMASNGGVITSGGGFSNLNQQPSYQSSAVTAYLDSFTKSTAPYQGSSDDSYYYDSYRIAGRGYPDVALLARDYEVMLAGELTLISGTSAATPVLAGTKNIVQCLEVLLVNFTLWKCKCIHRNGSYHQRSAVKRGQILGGLDESCDLCERYTFLARY